MQVFLSLHYIKLLDAAVETRFLISSMDLSLTFIYVRNIQENTTEYTASPSVPLTHCLAPFPYIVYLTSLSAYYESYILIRNNYFKACL